VFWQNRSFYIGVGSLGAGTLNQQNVVALYNAFTTTQVASQTATGQCPTGASYWDLGVRGDTAPGNHSSTLTLTPTYSVLTNPSENGTGTNNILGDNPTAVSQYCNGSRVPPEAGGSGWAVPPGISDATVPNPIFNLTPAATVDEGNNWINISWGPLAQSNDGVAGGINSNYGGGLPLGNYALQPGSPAIDYIPVSTTNLPVTTVPTLKQDFFGNPRPEPGTPAATRFDVGAVEYQAPVTGAIAFVSPTSLSFGSVRVGTASTAQTLTLHNDGVANLTGITITVTAPFSRATAAQGGAGSCGVTLTPAAQTCTINVVFTPTANGAASGTATITGSMTVNGSPVALTGTGVSPAAMVSPSSLAFGIWATGTTSPAQTVTVTNTGGIALAGGTFTFGGGSTQFSRATAAQGGAGTCPASGAATLAVGATCTINVVFAPTATGSLPRTLTVAYTGATVTGSPVSLTGTGANLAVNPSSLSFTNVPVGTTSAAQTLTVHNATGGAPRSLALTFTGPFSRPTGAAGGTCGATLTNNGTCTINVVYSPTGTPGSTTGSLAIATNGGFTVANSPVGLSGTSVAQVVSATLTPTAWSPTQTRNCPTPAGACLLDPAQMFTLTNTGNVTLTGIGQSVLAGTNAADYTRRPALSGCGPNGGGQVGNNPTLAPGGTCVVTVSFTPLTSEAAGTKNATVSVTSAAGTKTSILTGTAN
jgi:hypothetical protein